MSNTATIKGDTSVVWGVRGKAGDSIAGILQSVRNQLTGEMVEIADEDGFTVAKIFFNHKNELEVTVLVKTSFPVFARGDTVSIGGVTNAMVDDFEKQWENKGVAKYTLKATAYSGIPTP